MIIPHKEIQPETLNSLIEEYVLREGTDYGTSEVSLDTKVKQILSQLDDGKLVITYSELHETCSISPSKAFS